MPKKYKPKFTNSEKQEMVVTSILKAMEDPSTWRKAWKAYTGQFNRGTERRYSGMNALYLALTCMQRGFSTGQWLTANQIKKMGGSWKGSATYVKAWLSKDVKNKDGSAKLNKKGEQETTSFPVRHALFNMDQTVDIDYLIPEGNDNDTIEVAENCSSKYLDQQGIPLHHKPGQNWYCPSTDDINVLPIGQFDSSDYYYKTLFHEIVHSTGHESRLNRDGVAKKGIKFGSKDYSKEELIAEFGACMICSEFDLDLDIQNSSAYLAGRAKKIKSEDKQAEVVKALSGANKAVTFIFSNCD